MAIFEPGIADIFCRHIGESRQLSGDPLGVGACLFNPEKIVLTVVRKLVAKFLGDLEICRLFADTRRK